MRKQLKDFEATHGQSKIKRLEHTIEVERAKVEALAGLRDKPSIIKTEDTTFKFALLGDLHIGSLYAKHESLVAFYEYAHGQGVTEFFIAGDVLDGWKVFKGQEFELRDVGLDAQLERLKDVAPDIGFTRFITGNHDSSFKNLAGAPVGKMIEKAVRNDAWQFIGEEQGRVKWETPNGKFELMMIHPGGGSSYAISYRSQKIVESLEGGTKPDMLAIGHYHKAEMIPSYRNVCAVQVGTMCAQTPFMARNGLAAHVGGWIMEVHKGKGHNCIKGEFVAFYV